MKTKLNILAAALTAITCTSAAFGAVVTDGTQTRNNSSERVPLVSLIMPALQQLGPANKVASGCFTLLSNPTIEITREVEVKRDGSSMESELNNLLSVNAGKIIGCTAAIASQADDISSILRQQRPRRDQAIEIIKAYFTQRLEPSYTKFKLENQAVYDIPVLIAKGNNGFSKDYMAFNDVLVEVEKQVHDVTGDAMKSGGGKVQAKGINLKTIVDGGVNNAKMQASTTREIIFGGVYAFSTNPMKVNTVCSTPTASKTALKTKGQAPTAAVPCVENYSIKFENSEIEVKKSGQRWFDHEFIGGAIYAIELSGEKSTSTSKKVER